MSFDWSNAAENALAGGLGLVPGVGSLLGALVYIFWPKPNVDIWKQIEKDVENMVDQKISQEVLRQVNEDLAGLRNVLAAYLLAAESGDKNATAQQWIASTTVFDSRRPHFQSRDYQLVLLPIFVQFANMNLSLLRDGALFGASWGWNEPYQKATLTRLLDTISEFTSYAENIYQQGLQNIQKNTPVNIKHCQPWRAMNTYNRNMGLTAKNFTELWQYFDVKKYPDGVNVKMDWEIYSDPVGTLDGNNTINLPSPPTAPIQHVSVWAWNGMDGIQLTYPPGGGPNGVTTTPRMGDQNGGSNAGPPPHGGVFSIDAGNPVTAVGGNAGDILTSFNFTLKDGGKLGPYGANIPHGASFSFTYPGLIMSSVYIHGVSIHYKLPDCAVFGFKNDPANKSGANTMRNIYVGSPDPETAVPDAANVRAAGDSWDADRQEFWKYMKACAAENG